MTDTAAPKAYRVLALIPAYNEERSVGGVVSKLRELGFDVLVVDDGSPDGTSEVAEKAGAQAVRLPVHLGYGGALQTGYMYACNHGYDSVVQLDGDGQHDPSDARLLLEPILSGQADVTLGSRFMGVGEYRMPLVRSIGRRIFVGLVRLFTGNSISDPTTGYQALSSAVLHLYCSEVFPEDYPDADMLVILHRHGFRVREVPVRMSASGHQSMHRGIFRSIYYAYKMALSIAMALIRKIR